MSGYSGLKSPERRSELRFPGCAGGAVWRTWRCPPGAPLSSLRPKLRPLVPRADRFGTFAPSSQFGNFLCGDRKSFVCATGAPASTTAGAASKSTKTRSRNKDRLIVSSHDARVSQSDGECGGRRRAGQPRPSPSPPAGPGWDLCRRKARLVCSGQEKWTKG